MLLVVTIGLLITPSMEHRIVERGQDSVRVLKLATGCGGWALIPLAIALAFDFFIALERIGGARAGAIGAFAFFGLAVSCWFVLGFWLSAGRKVMPETEPRKETPLEAQVDQLLTEARVIIPGRVSPARLSACRHPDPRLRQASTGNKNRSCRGPVLRWPCHRSCNGAGFVASDRVWRPGRPRLR